MITVYGADWCEDTRRSQRLLRRLHVPHHYINIDEDLDGLERAKALNHGERRTPTIDLGIGGPPLVEPDNETLAGALVEREMLTQEEAARAARHPERGGRRAGGAHHGRDRLDRRGRRLSDARCAGRCGCSGWSPPRPASPDGVRRITPPA